MKIAAAQIACVVGDVTANLRKIRAFAGRARQGGAEWIVFPEMSDTGYVMAVIRAKASHWSEGAVPELCSIAREVGVGIVCGVSEKEDRSIYNSQVVIDSNGTMIGKYRKTHLFAPRPVEEHKCFAAGADLGVLPLAEFRAGLSICYDLRFPELFRTLACEQRANLFVISSAWPSVRLEHLRILVQARAIENQSYAVLANRTGVDNGASFCGHSAIVDPFGRVIAAASTDREELLQAEISTTVLEEFRQSMPVFVHRRPEVYGKNLSQITER